MAAKPDMERIGLFKEMGYHTVGDPYASPGTLQFNQSATRGKQMLIGSSKSKNATSAGYFNEFSRVFGGESITDPVKLRRQHRLLESKKHLGKDWMPSSYPKEQSGTGSCYGNFTGPIEHFSGSPKAQTAYKAPGKNVYTNPPKQGTGYGYIGVTLNKYPEYKSDKYEQAREIVQKENSEHRNKVSGKGVFRLNMHPTEYFDSNPYKGDGSKSRSQSAPPISKEPPKPFKPSSPSKKSGGMKAGCFDPFPTYPSNPYLSKGYSRPVQVTNSTGKTFIPSPGPKSYPINSVLYQNIHKTITPINYKRMNTVMSY